MTAPSYEGTWEVYPGNEMTTLALPDYYSVYLSYTFDTSRHPNAALRISGDFPYARYMSFNVYATRSGTSLGALTDYQIWPQAGSVNPFVAGSDAQARNRRYVVSVVPANGDGQQAATAAPVPENLLPYNADDLQVSPFPEKLLTVIIRYYLPTAQSGGMTPPTVEAYDASNGTPFDPQPQPYPTFLGLNEPIFRQRLSGIFDTVSGDKLRFYHAAGGGQFNNADNLYLIAAVENVDGRDNLVMLRLKPPTFPSTTEEFDQTTVRYWSVNQGDPGTSTPAGMHDSQLRPARDGYTYVVMGGDEGVQAKAEEGGYNYMPWRANKKQAVILYRNMLTNPQYRYSIARVPQLPKGGPWGEGVLASYEAARHLGEYAPMGRKVTAQVFNASYGGWPAPGFMRLPT